MEIIIKLDHDEQVKVKTSSIYGEMPQFPDMNKIRDEFCTENYIGKMEEKIDRFKMDLQNRDDEIQDLKLENDRLKQREDKMKRALKAICCYMDKCDDCLFKKHNLKCESSASDIAIANITLKELEDL